MREFHFYTSPYSKGPPYEAVTHTWDRSEYEIKHTKENVHTTQMGLLNAAWDRHFECGDRVFIHDPDGVFELKEDCERTDRILRRAHNVFKLFAAGEFSSGG